MPGTVKEVCLDDVLNGIKTGVFMGYDMRAITKTIASVPNDSKRQDMKRQNLPVALVNGTFSYKNKNSITRYSSFTALDFDHIKNQNDFSRLWIRLCITPCVYSVFKSVSGWGIKAIIMHDSQDYNDHEELYEQLLAKFYVENITDILNIDLARGSYLCYDPDLFINPHCVPYHFAKHPLYKPKTSNNMSLVGTVKNVGAIRGILSLKQVKGNKSDESIIAILGSFWRKDPRRWQMGNRANSVFKSASELCNAGVNIDKAVDYLINAYSPTGLTCREIMYHAHRGYINNYLNYGMNRTRFDRYGSTRR